ncbi:MAG: hypothetical protein KAS38_08250, partial [Anaerolineales bacterium]|nr:hypothetical protein [Anaerolineales bacterium]
GLRDTIKDYDDTPKSTGFLFDDATSHDFADAIKRALEVFSDQKIWRGLQQRGMSHDFSWERSARQYLDLYQSITLAQGESHIKNSDSDVTEGSGSLRGIPWRKQTNNNGLSKKK